MQTVKKLFMLLVVLLCGMTAAWGAQQVSVSATSNGQVTFSPEAPTAGQTVTITVTPNQGYCIHKSDIVVKKTIDAGSAQGPARIGIAGNIEISGTEPSNPTVEAQYTFTMPEEPYGARIDATFSEAPVFNITVDNALNGTVSIYQNKTTAIPGEEVSVSATPETGYEVENVFISYETEEGEILVDAVRDQYGYYNFTMPAADVTVYAVFKVTEYNVNVAPSENGTVTANKQKAAYGDEIVLTVTPNNNCKVTEVKYVFYAGGQSDMMYTVSPDANGVYKFNMPAADVTVSATFEQLPYNITVAETQNGSVSVMGNKTTANPGEQVTFSGISDPGYEVGEVKVTYTEGNEQKQVETTNENGYYSFIMPAADVTIAVTFVKKAYTVEVAQTENGTVTVDKTTANAGDEINVTITPAAGYEVDEQSYIYSMVGQDYTQTIVDGKFIMPYANVTVKVTFKALPVKKYNITVLETENGTAEVDKAQAAIGETVTITVTPAQGYELDQLTVSASYEIQGGGGEEPRAPRKMRADQGNITVTKVDDTHYTFVLPESLPNFLTPNYADNTEFQVKATFKKVKVLTPLHTILTEGVNGTDYTVAEAMAVVKVLGGDAYVTDGTDYIRLQLNDAIAEQLIEGNKSLEGTVTGHLYLRDTNPVLVVSELSENAVENDGISTAIQSVDMSQGMVPQVKLAQVVRMSGYWDGNALRAYSAAPQGQSLIITNNHMPANWQVGGNYTVTVAIYLNEAWEAEQPAGGAPRRVKAGDDLDFQNLRGELINLEITTAIDTLLMDSNVADVHYVNVAGQVSDRPFEGINIMVMKLNDGTTRTVKVVK